MEEISAHTVDEIIFLSVVKLEDMNYGSLVRSSGSTYFNRDSIELE